MVDLPYGTQVPPLEPAGFGIRFLARLIDTLVIYGVSLGTGFMGGIVIGFMYAAQGGLPSELQTRLGTTTPIDFVLSIIGSISYYAIAEAMGARTIGKAITGLAVIHEDGDKGISIGQGFGRNAAYLIDALFFGLVAYSKMKNSSIMQRYGDEWAGTRVVKKASLNNASFFPSGEMLMAGIAGGVIVAALFAMLQLALKMAG